MEMGLQEVLSSCLCGNLTADIRASEPTLNSEESPTSIMSSAFEDDIEDMGTDNGMEEEDSHFVSRNMLQPLLKSNFLGEMHKKDVEEHKDTIPGTQKIYLKTYGCSHNVSDSEYMAGILQTYGYRITTNKNDADLWLVNSCTVKDPSQAAFMHLVNSGVCARMILLPHLINIRILPLHVSIQ